MMRVIVVHTLEDALAALEAAAELGKPVTLQSAPDALFYAGGLYLLHLFSEARKAYPDVDATCIIDCDGAGAETLQAMQTGHAHLRIAEPDNRIQDIAAQYGIKVHSGPYEALDLLEAGDTKSACKHWLSSKSCEPR